jgi:hypothetical protein
MLAAIRAWMIDLNDYPGWLEWKRKHVSHTLHFDDPFLPSSEPGEDEFKFSDEVGKQHTLILQYLGLKVTIDSLKECEFYFRRYPFRGLPVTHYSHITNVCEMYFGRFYEFKTRLKNYFEALKAMVPKHNLNIGKFIKAYEREFDQELRARNRVDHHGRFEDVAIDRIYLTWMASADHDGWKSEHRSGYRKAARQWAQRVRRRGQKMDEFLEAVAAATLTTCSFLSDVASAKPDKPR